MLIKEKIKYKGNNMNFKISFSSNDDFVGNQQEIDSLTQFKTLDSVNQVTDEEKRRFKSSASSQNVKFYFHKGSGVYENKFTTAGFTDNEISSNSLNFLNSFFILDCYDTYDINSQTKIFTTYLTKKGTLPTYTIDNKLNQLYYQHIPISYINKNIDTIPTTYIKFSFFNAKTGKLTLFYNQDNESDLTPRRMFFNTRLFINGKTWRFQSSTIRAREITNNKYVEKMNETYDKFDDLQQIFPTGNAFSLTGGTINYLKV